MKNLAIAIVMILGTFAISASLEEETRIAHVDKEYVLSKMDEYAKAKMMLAEFENDDTRELEKAEGQIAELMARIEEVRESKGENTVDEKKMLKRIDALEKGNYELKEKIQGQKNEMWLKMTKGTMQRFEKALYSASVKKGYTHVFNKPNEKFEGELIIAPISDDITMAVMEALELRYEDYKLEKR